MTMLLQLRGSFLIPNPYFPKLNNSDQELHFWTNGWDKVWNTMTRGLVHRLVTDSWEWCLAHDTCSLDLYEALSRSHGGYSSPKDAYGEEPTEAGRGSQASSVLAQGHMCMDFLGVELFVLLVSVYFLTSFLYPWMGVMPRHAPEKAGWKREKCVFHLTCARPYGQSSEKTLLVLIGTDWQGASLPARFPFNQSVFPGQKGHSPEQD